MLRSQKSQHVAMILAERLEYGKKQGKAALFNYQFCLIKDDTLISLLLDCCICHINHRCAREGDEQINLVGFLEHGSPNNQHLFTMTVENMTDVYHIVEGLHKFVTDVDIRKLFPPKLYVQDDNYKWKIKKRYFLTYIDCLVAPNVFKDAEISFLSFAHTHNGTDQATAKRQKG